MNNNKIELDSLSYKLDELKNLFSVGERIVPGIQKLVDFINEMRPVLSHINESIEESNAKIPKASDHIVDVTSATEHATTEILNLIDTIALNISELNNILNGVLEQETENKALLAELNEILSDNLKGTAIVEKLLSNFAVSKLKDRIVNILDQITADSSSITIALQVQDITSQQLAAVNHLIISVQKRLTSLMFDLSDDEIEKVNKTESIVVPIDTNFDMNASFLNQKTSQDEIDKLISGSSDASQDEIDKLFG